MSITKVKPKQIDTVISIGDPGLDTNIPTEKAVRDAITAISGGSGDVYGDAGAIDEHLAVFDIDGYHIKDGGVVPAGGGDVLGPATNHADYLPQWNGADSKTLKDGLAIVTTVGNPGVDTSVPTDQAVREALNMFQSIVIHDVPTDVYVTQNINNTSYVGTAVRCFYIDFDVVTWTHFSIQVYGHSNAAGQTVTLQLSEDAGGFPALSAAGNDLVLSNVSQWWETGWIAISGSWTGIKRLVIAIKGSNSTVDFEFNHLSVMLKRA